MHRLTGLGVVLFLTLHVIDTSWAVFYPELYEKAIASYQSPLFTLGEFGLIFAVVYHAYNGLRIALIDYKPEWWRHQQKAALIVVGATIVTLIPVFVLMMGHVLKHYGTPGVYVMPLGEVLVEQLPFAVGIVASGVAALLFSLVSGLLVGSSGGAGDTVLGSGVTPQAGTPKHGSRIERFWWSYMRISGLLIVPLVFGHLAMMHVIQGVFDITTVDANVVGTGFTNAGGSAVEFVGTRWGVAYAGVMVWKVYDAALLILVTVHGFNGLRYVLTDYTMFSPLLRRAAIYFCVIGAVILLVLGVGALLGSINDTSIQMAVESACKLGRDLPQCP